MPKYEWNEDHQAIEIIPGTYKYRSKWACFDCRTSFTRVRGVEEPDEVICPNCQQQATDMGYLFEPPAKRDKRAWKVMEVLGRSRLIFRTAGNVAFIRYMITSDEQNTPEEVQRRIDAYFSSRRR